MERKEIEGTVARIRPINESDAEFMVEIRNKPENNRFLSNRNEVITLDSQKKWMATRYHSKDSIDFIIELKNTNRPVGCMAIYDIENGVAEFGRYIVENPIGAIEGEILALRYAFETLNIEKIYCKTVYKNKKVWEQHTKLGFITEDFDFDERIMEKRVLQFITKDIFQKTDLRWLENILIKFK